MPNSLLSENRAVYEIMSKNVVEPERPQLAIQHEACELHAGYLSLHTHQYVILTTFPQQQWFRDCASLLRFTCIVPLVPLLFCVSGRILC